MKDLVQLQASVYSNLNGAIEDLCRSTTKTMEAESDAFAHYLDLALSHCDLAALSTISSEIQKDVAKGWCDTWQDDAGEGLRNQWQRQVNEAKAAADAASQSAWRNGAPPSDMDIAWLRVAFHKGEDEFKESVVLGVLHENAWCEAGDRKGEHVLDPIWEPITGWQPYKVPMV